MARETSASASSSRARRAGARWLLAVGMLGLIAGAACARRVAPLPPDGLDYRFPVWSPGELSAREEETLRKAWRAVLNGDTRRAAGECRRLLDRRPRLVPARVALAFAQMRERRFAEAEAGFASVLTDRPDDVPAMIGAASLAAHRGDAAAALLIYARAADAAPGDRLLERRLQETKAQVTESRVAAAQAALARGDLEEAVASFRSALAVAPEVAGVRVALADALASSGDAVGALEVLERMPSPDPGVLERLAELRAEQGDLTGALDALRQVLELEPARAGARQLADRLRGELELLEMPEPYRRIPEEERISRADLAALIAVKVTALGQLPDLESRVLTDTDASWAAPYIQRVANLEILSVYPNHTFQPHATVRRSELAHAVGRVLDLVEWPEQPAPELRDIRPRHLHYRGVVRAVGAGLMDVTPTGAFEGWRPVTGQEAVAVIDGLARAVGP